MIGGCLGVGGTRITVCLFMAWWWLIKQAPTLKNEQEVSIHNDWISKTLHIKPLNGEGNLYKLGRNKPFYIHEQESNIWQYKQHSFHLEELFESEINTYKIWLRTEQPWLQSVSCQSQQSDNTINYLKLFTLHKPSTVIKACVQEIILQ